MSELKAKDKYILPFLTVFQLNVNVLFILYLRGCVKRRNIGGAVKFQVDIFMQGLKFIGLGKCQTLVHQNNTCCLQYLEVWDWDFM